MTCIYRGKNAADSSNCRGMESELHLYSVKSKLSTLVPDAAVREKISEAALKCHEAFKRGLFFLKAFFLYLVSFSPTRSACDRETCTPEDESGGQSTTHPLQCVVREINATNVP